MSNQKLFIEITFHMDDLTKTKIRSNVKRTEINDLLSDFLRDQIGAGKDDSKPNDLDSYVIMITLNLDGDVWGSKHNCGNLGLRDGIIMNIRQQINERGIDLLIDGALVDKNEPSGP